MNLLASAAWALDVAFFVIIFFGVLLGAGFGFLRGICKISGWILSIVLATSFCVPFKNNLESWFGLQTALTNSVGSAVAASWISTAIAFLVLATSIRLLAYLFGKIGGALIGKSAAIKTVDRFLGALLGAVGAAAVIFLLLAIFYWVSIPGANEFISESTIVGAIFKWDGFRYAAHFSFLY